MTDDDWLGGDDHWALSCLAGLVESQMLGRVEREVHCLPFGQM